MEKRDSRWGMGGEQCYESMLSRRLDEDRLLRSEWSEVIPPCLTTETLRKATMA